MSILSPARERVVADGIDGIADHHGLNAVGWAVARHGNLVAVRDPADGGPAVFTIMSISKTLQNAGFWPLLAEGRVRLEAPVSHYLPAFAANGKDAVTVEQTMLHTGCFPTQIMPFPQCDDRATRLEAYARWTLEGAPGRDYRYHPGNGAWVLADIAEAATGVGRRELVNRHVLAPHGLYGPQALSLGLAVGEQGAVRPIRLGRLETGQVELAAFRPDPVSGEAPILARLNTPESRAIGLPGSGVTGTARALALLYQTFLANPQGSRDADVVRDATQHVRLRTAGAWGFPVSRTLGFIAAGDVRDRRGESAFFGTGVSPRAFGHDGMGGQMAWADPATGLSFAFLTDTVTHTPSEQVEWCGSISTLVAQQFGT